MSDSNPSSESSDPTPPPPPEHKPALASSSGLTRQIKRFENLDQPLVIPQTSTPASGSGIHYTQPASSSSQRLSAMNSFSIAGQPLSNTSASASNSRATNIRVLQSLKDLKASFEGSLLGVGLYRTLGMVCKSDGVLRIETKEFEGRIYIKLRKVVYACYGNKLGLEAIAKMEIHTSALFAYFQKVWPPETPICLDVTQLQSSIEKFRNETKKKGYY